MVQTRPLRTAAAEPHPAPKCGEFGPGAPRSKCLFGGRPLGSRCECEPGGQGPALRLCSRRPTAPHGSSWGERDPALGEPGRPPGQREVGASCRPCHEARAARPCETCAPPREPLRAAWPVWGVAAASPGLSRGLSLGERDTGHLPWWNAAGSAPLVMWFFIVGGLTVLWLLPAACELGRRAWPLAGAGGPDSHAGWVAARTGTLREALRPAPPAGVRHSSPLACPGRQGHPLGRAGWRASWPAQRVHFPGPRFPRL